MFSSKIKTPCGRAVEIRNVVLLLLLLSPIVHAGSPTMFTGVELVRSNLPVGSGRRCLCYLYPSGYFYNNRHRLSLCAARRSPLREVHDDVAISPHKSDRPPPGLRADKRKLDEPRTASLGGDDTAGPHFPYLASQQYDYLVKQLKNFQSGDRNNPIMATFAALVPSTDIPALAAFFCLL